MKTLVHIWKILKGIGVFILLVALMMIIMFALIMPENYDKHISQVMALVGALTALVSVVWTQYNKKIEEENKFRLAEYDKKHQISKETYQKLFDEKIKVYKSLYDELLKYKKRLADIGKEDYDIDSQGDMIFTEVTAEDVNISTLRDIFSIIEKNIFLISPKVEKIYSDLSHAYRGKENEFEFMLSNVISTEGEARDESDRLDKKFFEEHQNKIKDLFTQIEFEIKKMKTEIGFI